MSTITATTSGRRTLILAGLAVVGVAAAVLSFDTLNRLAEAAGYAAATPPLRWGVTLHISWLVPIAVDAFGLLATLAWLTPAFTKPIRDYARNIAVGDIALSAVLNAVYHGMKAAGWHIPDCWPAVIVVGAIPPVMVALALHLGSLVVEERTASAPVEITTEAVTEAVSEAPSAAFPDLAEVWAEVDGDPLPEPAPETPPAASTPALRKTRRKARKTASEAPASSAPQKRSLTDSEAADLLVQKHPHSNPSKRAARPLLGVHHDRLETIFELADRKRAQKHPSNVVHIRDSAAK